MITSYASFIIVNIITKAKVAIYEAGLLGENQKQVKIDMIKKYILVALVN